MSELLLVSSNNGIQAVLTKAKHDWIYVDCPSTPNSAEYQRRWMSSNVVVFAPRSRIIDWYQKGDARFLGISGSTEDLEAILRRHQWKEEMFYVPFSNGTQIANDELKYAASWETFRSVFGPNDWTFKFGRRPDWLIGQDDLQEHLLERAEHAMAHGAHLR